MRGWILFHQALDPSLPEAPEIFRFQESAIALAVDLQVLHPHRFDLIVGAAENWAVTYDGHAVDRPDFIMCRSGAETDYFTLALLRHFERRGVRLINSPVAIELVADKLHSLQQLVRASLPVPRTILGKFPIDASLIERELGFPVIVKTLKGTRGTGVLKCENRSQFEDLAGLLESANAQADFLMQHYIRASHGRDVRVLVVGGRVVAAMERRSLTGGFKSNVSLGGAGVAYNPPAEMAELAVKAADCLGLDVTGIDILFDDDGYRICEANSAPGFQGLERATGIDVPSAILRWIVESHDSSNIVSTRVEDDALIGLVFGGRSGLRELIDRSTGYRQFAGGVGLRLIEAGVSNVAHAALPAVFRDHAGRPSTALHALFSGQTTINGTGFDDREQEKTLLVMLGVSIWAAVLPWLAGADAAIGGVLSFIALLFPVIFVLTSPGPRSLVRRAVIDRQEP